MDRKVFIPLIGLLLFSYQVVWASSPDSLRLETIDGQDYVIHQIDPGETLYSISKRYRASMNAIADANPEVINGIVDGMIIRVPYKPLVNNNVAKRIHTVALGETLYSISRIYDISVVQIMEWNDLLSSDLEIGQELKIGGNSPPQQIDFVRDGMKIHIVQASEGLYAIARIYDVSVDDVVAWNDLEARSLNLGQEIIVGKDVQNEVVVVADSTSDEVDFVTEEMPVEPMLRATIKTYEDGLAAEIEGSIDDKTYLAMHRTIPIGSLVGVRNEMNHQMVFVRIIGKLPDTGINEKVIIRLSKSAVSQLMAIDPKFRVEISYLVPEE
jgi:LysM repeat protein